MPRRFQFSLVGMMVVVAVVAMAHRIVLTGSQCETPWNELLFIVACGVCGAAFGWFWRLAVRGAILGLGLVIFATMT